MSSHESSSPNRHVVTLTSHQIKTGDCSQVPVHGLRWSWKSELADWVTFRLDDDAASRYRFVEDQPLSHTGRGVDRVADLVAESHGVSLTIRIRPRASLGPWSDGHVYFHLVGIDGTPNPPPFDPTIPNHGGPIG